MEYCSSFDFFYHFNIWKLFLAYKLYKNMMEWYIWLVDPNLNEPQNLKSHDGVQGFCLAWYTMGSDFLQSRKKGLPSAGKCGLRRDGCFTESHPAGSACSGLTKVTFLRFQAIDSAHNLHLYLR